jgi:CDP-paratose synthetase
MIVLILGGTGYLGSKLTRLLLDKGYTVIATKRQKSDISKTQDVNARIHWIDSSETSIKKTAESFKIDFAINMVCNYGKCNVLYDSIIESNLEFPLNVLNILVDKGVRNYLTIGTSLPTDFNMYSFSKSILAQMGKFYYKKHNVNFYNIKLEMFYGADEPTTRFIPSIIRKMIKGETVETTIGTQKRDIIASDDVIDAVLKVIESNPVGYYDISLGTGIAPTISELLDYIAEETGNLSIVKKGAIPMRPDEPDCVADVTVLKDIIGEWEPTYWKNGIAEMINIIKYQEG